MTTSKSLVQNPPKDRLDLWKAQSSNLFPEKILPITESIPKGDYSSFKTYKTLNRFRTMMGCSKSNLFKWGYSDSDLCDCGMIQTMEHLLQCPKNINYCSFDDVLLGNSNALIVVDNIKI